MALLWWVAAWCIGIWLARTLNTPGALQGWVLIGGLAIGAALLSRKDRVIRLFFACIMGVALGGARQLLTETAFTPADLAFYNQRGVSVWQGVVSDAPDIREEYVYLRVEMSGRVEDGKVVPLTGSALIQAPRFGGYQYGDRVEIEGEPLTPARFDTFDYRDYLARGGVYSVMYRATVNRIAMNQGNPLIAASFAVRGQLYALIDRLLPAPASALLGGILLGVDNELPAPVKNAFQVTGASHLIAISGSNMAVIAGMLLVLLRPVKDRRLIAIVLIGGLLGYGFFVGASAGVMRAALMTGLAVFAERVGRRSWGVTSLAATVFVLTLINPTTLADLGLILSSTATLGLLLYLTPLTQWVEARLPNDPRLKTLYSALLAPILSILVVQLTTLPVILLVFGRVSFLGMIANVLVSPVQGIILTWGWVALVSAWLIFPIGQVIGWGVLLALNYTVWIIQQFSALPGISVSVSVEPGGLVAYYTGLFLITTYYAQPADQRKNHPLNALKNPLIQTRLVLSGGVVIAALVWAMVGAFPDGQLRVYTLAVGEGHATLIRTPRGGTILLNGGENPARLRGALGERLPYFQREIDLVILTHPSPTHYAALNGLVNHYTLRQVISFSDLGASTAAQTLRNTFGESAIQWSVLSEGYTLETEDGVRLSFWGRPNAPQSPALIRLSYGDAVFLFATALDASLIAAVESQFVGATVLALPARSLSNLTPNFLARVAPQALLIEAEPASRYKPALPEVTPLFQQMVVVNTAEKGAVEWGTDGKTLRVTTGK